MTSPLARAAVDVFHQLLRGPHGPPTHAALSKAIVDGGMMFLGRPICEVARPFFIARTTYDAACRAAGQVAEALGLLARRLAVTPQLVDALGLTDHERQMLARDPTPPTEAVGRFDGFLGPSGEVRFVEYNPMPAGLISGDELRAVYDQLAITAAFRTRYRTTNPSTSTRLADALIQTHARLGGQGRPQIAVLRTGARDGSTLLELDEMTKMVGIIIQAGIAVRVATPDELSFEGGRLRIGDFAIDAAVVDDWPAFVRAVPAAAPFWRALQQRALWLINSAATAILRGSKSVLAMLTDPAYHTLLSPELAAAVARHVPWTRTVRPQTTTYQGQNVDLLPFLARHREHMVLKPADEYGAKGVVLGWQCSDAEWGAAIDRAIATPYVAQDRVELGREPFAAFVDGELRIDPRHFTFDPFVWNDTDVHGAYIRLSKSDIMNLSAGGGSNTPMVIVEGEVGP